MTQNNSNSTVGTISGIIRKIRDLGKIIFFHLETTAGFQDLTVRKDTVDESHFKELKNLSTGDYCSLKTLKNGDDLLVVKLVDHIPKQGNFQWSLEKRMLIRAHSFVLNKVREFFLERDFCEVRLPAIHLGHDTSDIFPIDFFGKKSRLSSSNALFMDISAQQLQDVFSIQKCFRGEKSHTSRHLAEFDMLEVARLGHPLEHCIENLETLIKYLCKCIENSPFAKLCPNEVLKVVANPFSVIDYKDVVVSFNITGKGLGEYEREIAKSGPVFVENFPRCIASWTARPVDSHHSRSFNLLLPNVGEVAEGTEKQTDPALLRKKFSIAGVEKQLGWYADMMIYPHSVLSAFGVGMERLSMWLLGRSNIRDILPFYRDTRFSEIKNTGE